MIVLSLLFSLSAASWLAQLGLLLRARAGVTRVAQLPLDARPSWPKLSLVMPARNEAEHLERALTSKVASTYPNLELVLVNDRSTDETGAIAEAFAAKDGRLRVVHVHELPDGWLGKVHAMARGFEACTGEYVLFSDADIVIEPGALERVVGECERRRLDFLTIFPRVDMSGLLLTLTLATMFRLLVLFTRPWAVREPSSSASIGVGAFSLVRREALAKTPGLAWLRMETGDDVTLGWMMKRWGGRCEVLLGGDDVHLVFYPTFGAMQRAVEKNGGSAPFPLLILGVAALLAIELGVFAGFALGGPWAVAAGGLLAYAVVVSAVTARWLGHPAWTSPLAPLGVLPLAWVIGRSAVLALVRGGIAWRGTFYPAKVVAEGRRLYRPDVR